MATMSYSPSITPRASMRGGSRSTARRAATRPVRLTRRGRLLITVALAMLAGVGWVATHAGTAQAEAPMRHIEVHAGDTLWSIAQRVAPGEDPRAVIYDLRALNHLSSAQLQPGQILLAR